MEESPSLANSGRDRSAETGETLRTLREQADQTLEGHRRRLTNIESELNLHFQQITEELARDRVVDDMEVEASQKLRAEFQRCREMLVQVEGDLEGLRQEAEEANAQLEARTGELQQLREQLSGKVEDHDARFVELQAECDRLSKELPQLQETLAQARRESESSQEQLSALSVEHGVQLAEQIENRKQLQEQIDETQAERDRFAEQLEQLREKNHEMGDESSRLQEELETAGQLREDRDVLAARVEELENTPPGESDADHQQELSDLQRRYEMAAEEVHQLKQDHASLQEQLRCTPDAGPAIVDESGPLDWQAQKALLLAELEAEENGGVTPERCEARTSIEGTISITDRVVAEKEQEICQLQKLLDSQPTAEPIVETPSEPHAELFDQDELIQAERTRLEEVTQEMEAKLREAELEISVKRATLAREQAALKEKLAQLPDEKVVEEKPEAPGKPRRRWLSALGLKEDEE